MQDKLSYNDKNFIIQKVFKEENYKIWSKVKGDIFCTDDTSEETQSNQLKVIKSISSKVEVVYLTEIDLIECAKYIPIIAQQFHFYGFYIAVNLEKNFQSKNIFKDEFASLNIEEYLNKFKAQASLSEWISYIVIDNVIDGLTYTERRSLEANIRSLFPKSFIGFRFTNNIKPTPENKHPNRQNISWNDFLPKDDDGDFIITNFAVNAFKRTAVYSESFESVSPESDGQFIN